MPNGTHNDNCASAKGHQCRCGGCGGALHGWQGWVRLANSDDDRRQRREQLTASLTRRRDGRLRRDRPNRGRVTDLARLDVADWLGERRQQKPVSDLALVEDLGAKLAADPWLSLKADLDTKVPDPDQVRKELAHHTWCDLLIALVRLMDGATQLSSDLGDRATAFVVEKIMQSSEQQFRQKINEEVLGIVVGNVFTAIRTATIAHVPVLELLRGERALLALRILALFACPAPEDHLEVRKYALDPLAGDGRDILTARAKEWLGDLLPDWAAGSPKPI